MTTFAERLKNAMEQANMSQSALSEQAGASKEIGRASCRERV